VPILTTVVTLGTQFRVADRSSRRASIPFSACRNTLEGVGASRTVPGEEDGNVRTRGAAAVLAALAIVTAACSDDDDATPTTTAETPPTTSPETTAAPTTSAPVTPVTTASSPPPTTQSVDQLKAEVVAAFLALEDKNLALLMNPNVPDLEASIAEIAIAGTAYAQQIESRVNELIANGQSVRLNDPNLRSVTVEQVQSLDPPSNDHVNVTACQVGNAILVKNADVSPIPGRSIPVGGTGQLVASRFTVDLVRTPAGWRHAGAPGPDSVSYPGASECPPK
jgi:hypothetical protein